ncbi:MAG: LysR family transcriptional regulator [Acidobacteria bacterium]|nr:LysR family transcriptional regulator [Acidobacteriota bacterium]
MELRHLRYLMAVAEELNFGRAAIRLRISQPPLSQQIRQLEEELGVRLFERTKRRVRLTEAGKRIVLEAEQILKQVDHFVNVASRVSEGAIGRLSVTGTALVNDILVQVLRRFAQQYPGVHIELQLMNTAMQIEALRDQHVHVGFLSLPVDDSNLYLENVKREPMWLAVPKNHALAKHKKVPLASLEKQPFVMFERRCSPGLHDLITSTCRTAGFSLNVVHEVDNVTATLMMVTAGLGLAFCSPAMRKSWPDIAFRPFREAVPALEYAVGYRSDSQSPLLHSFLKVVRQVARQSSRAHLRSLTSPGSGPESTY